MAPADRLTYRPAYSPFSFMCQPLLTRMTFESRSPHSYAMHHREHTFIICAATCRNSHIDLLSSTVGCNCTYIVYSTPTSLICVLFPCKVYCVIRAPQPNVASNRITLIKYKKLLRSFSNHFSHPRPLFLLVVCKRSPPEACILSIALVAHCYASHALCSVYFFAKIAHKTKLVKYPPGSYIKTDE